MKAAELMARLLERLNEPGALERVGAAFNRGAELPGTFQRGRTLGDTPERLASQFDWSTPTPKYGDRNLYLPTPEDPTVGAHIKTHDRKSLEDYWAKELGIGSTNGVSPYLRPGALPDDANLFHLYDTQPLTASSRQGSRAYPTLYGNTLLTPGAYNVKGTLTGSNAHRNNYALASMIMRRPDAGERLLASPEQFVHLPMGDKGVAQLRRAGPDYQVGALQGEGALQLLRRLGTASELNPGLRVLADEVPQWARSSTNPQTAERLGVGLRRADDTPSMWTVGPKSLRKLGIVQDALDESPVDPGAFRGLEFRQGGAVSPLASCRCL